MRATDGQPQKIIESGQPGCWTTRHVNRRSFACDPRTHFVNGCLPCTQINEKQLKKTLSFIEKGKQQGARLVTGVLS